MFTRLTAVSSLAILSLLAVATPNPIAEKRGGQPSQTVTVTAPATTPTSVSTCSTGDAQCCNSVTSASNPAAAGILSGLGIVLQGVTADVGLTCSPITAVGAGGGSCDSQAVCCQDNSFGGLISLGCLPITL
ncbi:uncharacterized protein PHACADRAFT_97866 [Phanerochaete carnosa HHB-10118-sp]|uniref:Hydrophobin n=1 Tax=Phanerochaete carnosa (strain HHB-10118-sp) TaxID=650164 RepID=K5W4R7_PHACS|nr:uncharacterized protein PHACADRAFT_97866 [Phanerochaete carnosa HHB-10118-sp]EKM54145.1 hypothetical protein PHACADRAFT_97866 [Phanerochaete carnosa HHB-10118-sp]